MKLGLKEAAATPVKGQSKRMSAIEALCNVMVGYLVSVAANIVVLPSFGYNVSVGDSFAIGLAFTVISLIRSYFLRRVFNWVAKEQEAKRSARS